MSLADLPYLICITPKFFDLLDDRFLKNEDTSTFIIFSFSIFENLNLSFKIPKGMI